MMSYCVQSIDSDMEVEIKCEKIMNNSVIEYGQAENSDESNTPDNKESNNCDVICENTTLQECKLNFLKLHENKILIPKLSAKFQVNAIAIITATVVANTEQFTESTPQVFLSLYFGVYNIYLEFLESPIITHWMHKYGYKITEVTVEEWTSWISLKRKNTSQIVSRYLLEPQELLPRIAWTLLGPLLCLLGHTPTPSNINFWGNKMLNSFQRTTNLRLDKFELLHYPSVAFAQAVSNLLEHMFDLRRHLFLVVYSTATTTPCLSAAVCRLAVEHLKGVNLLDFVLIDQFILNQNPFSLLLKNIAKHSSVLLEAYDRYMSFGNLAPWCTLTFPQEDWKIFNSDGFKYVAEIARGVAYLEGITQLEDYHPYEVNSEIEETVNKASQLLKEMRAKCKRKEETVTAKGNLANVGDTSTFSDIPTPNSDQVASKLD